jgi:ribosome maturation factor RimP
MVIETQIQQLESMVNHLMVNDQGYFLVEIKIKPINNIKVFLDGDSGISIEKCIQYNRALYKKIEEAQIFPDGDFSLEISSPGLDEPLKLIRQYKKNTGRLVEVVLFDGSKLEGRLTVATEDGIIVEEIKGKNKKQEIVNHSLLFTNIKTTKIQVVF